MKSLFNRIRIIWLWIGLGLAGLFIYACLMPNPPQISGFPHFDKLEHGFAFLLMSLWFGALFRLHHLYVLLVLSAFGAVTEIMQATLTYVRGGEVMDWVADTFGVVLGLLLLHLVRVDWVAWVCACLSQGQTVWPTRVQHWG